MGLDGSPPGHSAKAGLQNIPIYSRDTFRLGPTSPTRLEILLQGRDEPETWFSVILLLGPCFNVLGILQTYFGLIGRCRPVRGEGDHNRKSIEKFETRWNNIEQVSPKERTCERVWHRSVKEMCSPQKSIPKSIPTILKELKSVEKYRNSFTPKYGCMKMNRSMSRSDAYGIWIHLTTFL